MFFSTLSKFIAVADEAATTSTDGTTSGLGQYGSLIIIVAFFAIMYFLLIRPENKKQKKLVAMRNQLKVGDTIVTIGGIMGKVVTVKEDRVTIATGADKVKLEFTKNAIADVIVDGQSKAAAPQAKEEPKAAPKKIKKLGEKTEAEKEPAVSEEVAKEEQTEKAE